MKANLHLYSIRLASFGGFTSQHFCHEVLGSFPSLKLREVDKHVLNDKSGTRKLFILIPLKVRLIKRI